MHVVKKIVFILTLILILIPMRTLARYTDGIMLTVDSNEIVANYSIKKDFDGNAVLQNGTVYAPLNVFSRLYSRSEEVEQKENIYKTKIFNRDLILYIKTSDILFDGNMFKIDSFELDGIPYVAVRQFAENILGLDVHWKDGKILLCSMDLSMENVEYTFEKYSEYINKFSAENPIGKISGAKITYGNYEVSADGKGGHTWRSWTWAYPNDGYAAVINSDDQLGLIDAEMNFTGVIFPSRGPYDETVLMPPRCGFCLVARKSYVKDSIAYSGDRPVDYPAGDYFVDVHGNRLELNVKTDISDGAEICREAYPVDSFYDGAALLRAYEYPQGEYDPKLTPRLYIINTDGEITGSIDTQVYECGRSMYDMPYNSYMVSMIYFGNGLLPVLDKKTGKYGYVNKTGELIIDCDFDYASVFKEGLATVEFNGNDYYIDVYGVKSLKQE